MYLEEENLQVKVLSGLANAGALFSFVLSGNTFQMGAELPYEIFE
jgi:hypothetical protein